MQARGEIVKAYPIGNGSIARRWFCSSVGAMLDRGKKDRGTGRDVRGGKSNLTLLVLGIVFVFWSSFIFPLKTFKVFFIIRYLFYWVHNTIYIIHKFYFLYFLFYGKISG